MVSEGCVGRGCGRTFTLAYGVATDGRATSVKRRSQPGPNSWTGALTPVSARPRAQRDRPYTRCTSRATTSTVPCASAHRAPMRKLLGKSLRLWGSVDESLRVPAPGEAKGTFALFDDSASLTEVDGKGGEYRDSGISMLGSRRVTDAAPSPAKDSDFMRARGYRSGAIPTRHATPPSLLSPRR